MTNLALDIYDSYQTVFTQKTFILKLDSDSII